MRTCPEAERYHDGGQMYSLSLKRRKGGGGTGRESHDRAPPLAVGAAEAECLCDTMFSGNGGCGMRHTSDRVDLARDVSVWVEDGSFCCSEFDDDNEEEVICDDDDDNGDD